MPHDAQVLMNDYDFAQSAMLYSLSEIDISAVFAEAAERLTGERFDLRKSADGMLEGELCGKRLSVFDDGRWTYSFSAPRRWENRLFQMKSVSKQPSV